jgi:hypothetical protein
MTFANVCLTRGEFNSANVGDFSAVLPWLSLRAEPAAGLALEASVAAAESGPGAVPVTCADQPPGGHEMSGRTGLSRRESEDLPPSAIATCLSLALRRYADKPFWPRSFNLYTASQNGVRRYFAARPEARQIFSSGGYPAAGERQATARRMGTGTGQSVLLVSFGCALRIRVRSAECARVSH